jgi:hypothetical protein
MVELTGIDYEYEPQEIVGMQNIEGKLHFKVIFKGIQVPEYISEARMKKEFPKVNKLTFYCTFH